MRKDQNIYDFVSSLYPISSQNPYRIRFELEPWTSPSGSNLRPLWLCLTNSIWGYGVRDLIFCFLKVVFQNWIFAEGTHPCRWVLSLLRKCKYFIKKSSCFVKKSFLDPILILLCLRERVTNVKVTVGQRYVVQGWGSTFTIRTTSRTTWTILDNVPDNVSGQRTGQRLDNVSDGQVFGKI